MPFLCTCGTELPDNARFCFHCGKPQREQDMLEPEAEGGQVPAGVAQGPAPSAPVVPRINFGNPIAVRIALLCASLSILVGAGLSAISPVLRFACCLWTIGMGFLAALIYGKRTNLTVSVNDGMRLGWMSGVFAFIIQFVLTSVAALMALRAGTLREILNQALEQMPAQGEAMRQAIESLTPAQLGVGILISAAMQFFLTAALSIAGGALGAKVMEKE